MSIVAENSNQTDRVQDALGVSRLHYHVDVFVVDRTTGALPYTRHMTTVVIDAYCEESAAKAARKYFDKDSKTWAYGINSLPAERLLVRRLPTYIGQKHAEFTAAELDE